MDEHRECKETEDELWARIQRLERAVSVLARSNSNWAMNVSDADEEIISEQLRIIDTNNSQQGANKCKKK